MNICVGASKPPELFYGYGEIQLHCRKCEYGLRLITRNAPTHCNDYVKFILREAIIDIAMNRLYANGFTKHSPKLRQIHIWLANAIRQY